MATIDLATKLGANLPPSSHSVRFAVNYTESIIDFADAATKKGSNLAAADVIEAVDIPAESVILAAGVEVLTAVGGGVSVLTVDLGVTAVEPDNFLDGYDLFAAVAGDYGQQAAAYQPIVLKSADTIDLLLATQTGTLATGKVRVWALYGTVNDERNPGIAQLKS